MEEYFFLKSIAGPGVKYSKGSVVSLEDDKQTKSFLKNGVVVLYDDYVKEQKAKAKKKAALSKKAKRQNKTAAVK